MALNKIKIDKKNTIQIILILLGIAIIFFTYFYEKGEKKFSEKLIDEEKIEEIDEGISTFENVQYEGTDNNENKFIINSDVAEFTSEESNIIYMKKMRCKFFFKDGTVLRITSDEGIYDSITSDMEFTKNVEMYYLENRLYSEKAFYKNSENYLLVEASVVGEAPEGNLVADKLDFDLNEKKLKISMYNQDKVNIKLNY